MNYPWQQMMALRAPEFKKEGWNGYSALPLTDELLHEGDMLLDVFENGDLHIFPTGRNTLQFEWEHGDTYFEIELRPNGEMSIVYLKNKNFKDAITGECTRKE